MNLHHLTIFEAVAQDKSISRAAERLLISQPAVSKQLRLLERSLGTPLVDRLPKGVRLTAAGELLTSYARQISALSKEAQQRVAELQGLRRGKLVIGSSTTPGIYFLPELLARFRQRYPQIDLDLEVANTHIIQQYLTEYRVDVAITEGFVHWPELAARVFMMDELVAIVPPGHALTKLPSVSLRQFCAEPMLLREQGSGTREVIEEALAKRKVAIRSLMTLGSTEAIKRSVAAGVGVAFVSRMTIQHELQDKRLVNLKLGGFRLPRALHVVQVHNRNLSAAGCAFLDLLKEIVPEQSPRNADH